MSAPPSTLTSMAICYPARPGFTLAAHDLCTALQQQFQVTVSLQESSDGQFHVTMAAKDIFLSQPSMPAEVSVARLLPPLAALLPVRPDYQARIEPAAGSDEDGFSCLCSGE